MFEAQVALILTYATIWYCTGFVVYYLLCRVYGDDREKANYFNGQLRGTIILFFLFMIWPLLLICPFFDLILPADVT